MAERKSSSILTAPLHGAVSVLRKVPGAGLVGRAAQGTLDRVGAVSPRGRRLVVYTGAGVLGVAGVVEWPVALTGAAVAWLTQPRPEERPGPEGLEDGGHRVAVPGAGARTAGDTQEDGGPETGEAALVSEPASRNTARATGTAGTTGRRTPRKGTAAPRGSAQVLGGAALRAPADTGPGGQAAEEGPGPTTKPAATKTASKTSASKASTGKSAASKSVTAKTSTSKSALLKASTSKAATTKPAAAKAAKSKPATTKAAKSTAATGESAASKSATAKSSSRASTGRLGPTTRPSRTTI